VVFPAESSGISSLSMVLEFRVYGLGFVGGGILNLLENNHVIGLWHPWGHVAKGLVVYILQQAWGHRCREYHSSIHTGSGLSACVRGGYNLNLNPKRGPDNESSRLRVWLGPKTSAQNPKN
jgi:hypothetical protein